MPNRPAITRSYEPNHLYPLFDNPKVRRALLRAIDQDAFIEAVIGDDKSLWQTPCGFFAPLLPMPMPPACRC